MGRAIHRQMAQASSISLSEVRKRGKIGTPNLKLVNSRTNTIRTRMMIAMTMILNMATKRKNLRTPFKPYKWQMIRARLTFTTIGAQTLLKQIRMVWSLRGIWSLPRLRLRPVRKSELAGGTAAVSIWKKTSQGATRAATFKSLAIEMCADVGLLKLMKIKSIGASGSLELRTWLVSTWRLKEKRTGSERRILKCRGNRRLVTRRWQRWLGWVGMRTIGVNCLKTKSPAASNATYRTRSSVGGTKLDTIWSATDWISQVFSRSLSLPSFNAFLSLMAGAVAWWASSKVRAETTRETTRNGC